jgi:hypothetical protein
MTTPAPWTRLSPGPVDPVTAPEQRARDDGPARAAAAQRRGLHRWNNQPWAPPIEIATAPVPVLTLNGYTGRLTGVRFAHTRRCTWCKISVTSYADGGIILAGLSVSHSKKTVRWYETEKPAGRFAPPPTCPWCDETDAFRYSPEDTAAPAPRPFSLLDEIHRTIRANFPALVAQADDAIRRGW